MTTPDDSNLNGPYLLDLARKGLTLLPGESRKLAAFVDKKMLQLTHKVDAVLALHQQPSSPEQASWSTTEGVPLMDICDCCGDDYPCATVTALLRAEDERAD